MVKTLSIIGVVAALALAPNANAAPLVGGGGLTANAWTVVNFVQANYPGVNSIGGVRPCDRIGEHCAGRAIDVMVGGNTALGNTINNTVRGLPQVKYTLWQVASHYDHVHITVF